MISFFTRIPKMFLFMIILSYAELLYTTNICFYREIINLETEFLNNHDS